MTAALYVKQREAEIADLLLTIKDMRRPKSVREDAIRRIRIIEKEDGASYYGTYNRRQS